MNINVTNFNFSGKLYLKNPELWTEQMRTAIANNKYIRAQLSNKDVIGEIVAKRETKIPPLEARHSFGDMVYKVSFIIQDEKLSFADKIKKIVNPNSVKYPINRRFHSEATTVERIERFKSDK